MSQSNENSNLYTTGEIAKLCNVTVRTVQYYDSRNILIPSELSEGGRRLYSKEDLQRMKIICFLREIGLPIDTIGQLFAEEHPESVISILLEEQEKVLEAEIAERQEKRNTLKGLQSELKNIEHFTVESIGDIAQIMQNKSNLKRVRKILLTVGVLMDIIEVATFIYGTQSGIWWPFAIGMAVVIALGVIVVNYYYNRVVYICPRCHTTFKPSLFEMLFARHTPNTRRLHCTNCGHHGFCVETYGDKTSEKRIR